MPEILEKLRPDRDLQCYFFAPSAIAALSATSPLGFTVSGSWRQQFDWAVVEWNRDNVFEHPMFRTLPDGDLSRLTLTYDETRTNCIPLDSSLFPTVDWPTLRIWADDGTGEKVYQVPLSQYAVPISGSYQPPTAELELSGMVTPGDVVGIAFLEEHYPYVMTSNPLDFAIQNIVAGVNAFSPSTLATQNGTKILLTYVGSGPSGRNTIQSSTLGSNGNRAGLYTYASPGATEVWSAASLPFSGGTSPTTWRVTLPFASLHDPKLGTVPARSIRKMRWTYAADFQQSAFQRSEFQVKVQNWTVSGTGRTYSVAGPGSRRINDDDSSLKYSNSWTASTGNFFGGTIRFTTTPGESVQCSYSAPQAHSLFLGSRLAPGCTTVQVTVDGVSKTFNLALAGEDVLVRLPFGQISAGAHSVQLQHAGAPGTYLYFDFIELALPTSSVPVNRPEPVLTLATDWDTEHCLALAPERTAWMIDSLGFKGRVNHYAGALWFYELVRTGQQYASETITFSDRPDPSQTTQVFIATGGLPPVAVSHLNLIGDSAQTIAKAFELLINNGYTAIRAQASGAQLRIYARAMGKEGEQIAIGLSPSTQKLSGGADGDWRTDLTAVPRVNRAARDWTRSFCAALKTFGHDSVATALSMEIQHGDPSPTVGIAQRYPSQLAVVVSTPALQTNFSPQSADFWKQAHTDLAQAQADAGLVPYVQFGEVQWWYFPDGDHSGMPFYDAYTTSTFKARYGRDMVVFTTNTIDPATAPEEAEFLPSLIGTFTNRIRQFVLASLPQCRFEVLYPTDVNSSALNAVVNYPASDWTPDQLACLKTESFTYTFSRNLNLSLQTINAGEARGFSPSKRSHLVGIEEAHSAWLKEARMAEGKRFESVVLFALDQFCLMGYPLPLSRGARRSTKHG